MTISSSNAALSAKTSNSIRGHEPRLSTVLEKEISQDIPAFSLFEFQFNGVNYNANNIDTLNIQPMLYTPQQLKNAIIAGLKSPLSEGDAIDIDGDDGFTLSAIGELTVKIRDSLNRDITTSNSNFCVTKDAYPAPYKIEISGDVRLSTQYGDPNKKDYTKKTAETNYKQPLKQYSISVAGVCYAQPNIYISNTGHVTWENNLGFKYQSDTDGSKNFPKTGFNGALFNLKVMGVDATKLSFKSSTITKGNVTATITSLTGDLITIELSGPSSGQGNGLGPVKFEAPGVIMIQDDSNKIKYPFDVEQWFIPRRGTIRYDTALGADAYCKNLTGSEGDYRVPTRADYTNSDYADASKYPPYPETDGTNPIRGKYMRAIGGGLFAEWGYTDGVGNGYTKSDWQKSTGYWTSEGWSSTQQYVVATGSGYVITYPKDDKSNSRAACISN